MSALGDRFWPALIGGKPIGWFGDPDKRHSFTYLPDFAQSLITLAADSASWGRAWHVPSPATITPREVAKHAANLAQVDTPRLRRTPRLVMQLVGLAIPAAGELVEMEYAFTDDFIMLQDDWNAHFDQRATGWDDSLRATIRNWQALAKER